MRTLFAARSIGLYLAAFTMVAGPGHAAAEAPVPPVDVRVLYFTVSGYLVDLP